MKHKAKSNEWIYRYQVWNNVQSITVSLLYSKYVLNMKFLPFIRKFIANLKCNKIKNLTGMSQGRWRSEEAG